MVGPSTCLSPVGMIVRTDTTRTTMVHDSLGALDDLCTLVCEEELATWFSDGTSVAGELVRCPATEPDGAARQRLDLALRMLRGQAVSQWCRAVTDGAVVVRRWPLPARAVVLVEDGRAHALVLAVGRSGGRADVWRFRLGAGDAGGADDGVGRVAALLPA